MTQDLARRTEGDLAERPSATPAQELAQRIDRDDFRAQIQKALPDGVTVDRFVRATITALFQNPDIAEKCDHGSILQAAMRCAQDGLLPDGREAALVPFKGKATYIPMIGGYRKIAGEHGWAIETHAVFAGDDFDFELGLDPVVKHRPARPGIDRGQLVACYAIGRHRDGHRVVEVMGPDEVNRAKAVSKQPGGELWAKYPDRAWEKTVGRRLFAKLPLGEKEAERVRRMLDDLLPDTTDPAALLYGRPATAALASGRPDDPEPRRGDGNGPQDANGGTNGGPTGNSSAAAVSPGDNDPEPGAPAAAGITEPQRRRLWAIAKENGHDEQAVRAIISRHTGNTDGSTTLLTRDTYDAAVADLEQPATAAHVDDRAVRAGEMPIPDGSVHAGQTIHELAQTEAGLEWILWATRAAGRARCGDVFSDACITYISLTLPDIWAAHGQEAGAA